MSTAPDYSNAAPPTPDELAELKGRQDAAADTLALDNEVRAQRIRKQAAAVVAAELAGDAPPFDRGTLAEVLARPPGPPHRVAGLIPADADTVVVAQRKTGKTTFELNLARSLLTGETFLGRFDVVPATGTVAILNYEVGAEQLGRWADEAQVPADRLLLVNLRGRRNPLGHFGDRADLAAWLREHDVETVIVDPFGRAFVGKSQNDSGEVGEWLGNLDRFARAEVGARDVVLTVHAGWNAERTRGASAVEDWADSIITLVRDKDDDQRRFLRAEGRDVLVDEDRLDFDADTRTLTLAGAGSRKQVSKSRNVDDLVPAVVSAVTAAPGMSGYKLTRALRDAGMSFNNGDELAAARVAVEGGQLTVEVGARNAKRYHPAPDLPDLPAPPCQGRETTSLTSPIGGRSLVGRSSTEQTSGRSDRDTLDECTNLLHDSLGATPAEPLTIGTWRRSGEQVIVK